MKKKLVSVIIPCYNCELYVEQAVRSMMNQTYKNLEIITINDGSSDDTKNILLRLSSEDDRVRYVENEKNIKLIATLNKGLELANGEYIARMDADDISFPTRIEKQVVFLEKNPDIVVLGTNSWHIDESNMIIGHSQMPKSDKSIRLYARYASPFIHPSVMLRAEKMKGFYYDVNYIHSEDFKLWIDILVNFKGFNLEERLVAYRYNTDSVSHKFFDVQQEKTQKLIKPDGEFLSTIVEFENYKECVSLYIRIIKRNKFNFKNYISFKTLYKFVRVLMYYVSYKLKYKFFYKKKLNI